MNMNHTPLADRLIAWRDRNKLTNRNAAERVGVGKRTWESWVCGRRAPRGLALTTLLGIIRKPKKKTTKEIA